MTYQHKLSFKIEDDTHVHPPLSDDTGSGRIGPTPEQMEMPLAGMPLRGAAVRRGGWRRRARVCARVLDRLSEQGNRRIPYYARCLRFALGLSR